MIGMMNKKRWGIKRLITSLVMVVMMMMHGAHHGHRASGADVMDIGISARSIGMGRSYVGIGGRGEALFGNPAGMSGIGCVEISSMYGEMAGDVRYSLLGITMPLRVGEFGIGYMSNKMWDMIETTAEADGRDARVLGRFSYGNDLYILGYDRVVNDKTSVGGRLKYYKRGSGDLAGIEGSGINMDIGVMYRGSDKLRYGIVMNNIIGGDLGSWGYTNMYNEGMRRGVDVGVGYDNGRGMKLYGEFSGREGLPIEVRCGGEWDIWKDLQMRIGMEDRAMGGNESYINYTVGIGYRIGELEVNYAYYNDVLSSLNSRHFVGINVGLPYWCGRKAEEKKGVLTDMYVGAKGAVGKKLDIGMLKKKMLGIRGVKLGDTKVVKTNGKKAVKEYKNKKKNQNQELKMRKQKKGKNELKSKVINKAKGKTIKKSGNLKAPKIIASKKIR